MDELVSEEVYVAEDPVLETHSRQTYRVPNLRGEEGGLALDQNVEQEDVVCCQVDALLLVDADHLLHCHQNVDLQALDLLLPEHSGEGAPQLGRQGHHRDRIEGDGQGVKSVVEGIVEQKVFRFCFSEVDRRIVGLVRLKDLIGLASEAGHELMMNQLDHSVERYLL